jgi:hypothetical protein
MSYGLSPEVATLVGLIWLAIDAGSTASDSRASAPDARNAEGDVRQLWVHEDAKSIDHVALTSSGNLLVMTDDRIAVLDRATGAAVWSRDDIRGCSRLRSNNLVQFRHAVRCKYLGKFDLGFALVAGDPPLLLGHNPEDGQFAVIDVSNGRTLYDSDGKSLGKIREYSYVES